MKKIVICMVLLSLLSSSVYAGSFRYLVFKQYGNGMAITGTYFFDEPTRFPCNIWIRGILYNEEGHPFTNRIVQYEAYSSSLDFLIEFYVDPSRKLGYNVDVARGGTCR